MTREEAVAIIEGMKDPHDDKEWEQLVRPYREAGDAAWDRAREAGDAARDRERAAALAGWDAWSTMSSVRDTLLHPESGEELVARIRAIDAAAAAERLQKPA